MYYNYHKCFETITPYHNYFSKIQLYKSTELAGDVLDIVILYHN